MIKVTAEEQWRKFNVRVGRKIIGEIRFSGRRAFARGVRDGESEALVWCGSCRTVDQAAQAILEWAGYGRAKSVKVEKVKGRVKS